MKPTESHIEVSPLTGQNVALHMKNNKVPELDVKTNTWHPSHSRGLKQTLNAPHMYLYKVVYK